MERKITRIEKLLFIRNKIFGSPVRFWTIIKVNEPTWPMLWTCIRGGEKPRFIWQDAEYKKEMTGDHITYDFPDEYDVVSDISIWDFLAYCKEVLLKNAYSAYWATITNPSSDYFWEFPDRELSAQSDRCIDFVYDIVC